MYQISNKGRVKGLDRQVNSRGGTRPVRGKIIEFGSTHGYVQVGLSKDGKQKTFRLNRLVALHFIPNPDNLSDVDHIDGDKTNNNDWNLGWTSGLKNVNYHHTNNGTKKYGAQKAGDKWRVRMWVDGKRVSFGSFVHKEDAYQAFYNKYLELHGAVPWKE